MRKLDTFVADYPDTYKLTGQDEISKTYLNRILWNCVYICGRIMMLNNSTNRRLSIW